MITIKLFLLFFIISVTSIQRCKRYQHPIQYYKVRSCFKSTLPIIAWRNTKTVKDCMTFSKNRQGLAFNYSPPEAANLVKGFLRNCQVIGCPEVINSTTLVPDPVFDYYSVYGNINKTANATCLSSIGLFNLIEIKNNYTEAINYCQNLGGDLADILKESINYALGNLIQRLSGWYKAAYVGLDDIAIEGVFQTPTGFFLDCISFRAWSPGHPRKTTREDCVILDSNKVWRAINCKIKLPFICEYYPEAPVHEIDIKYQPDCFKIKSRTKKKKCIENNIWFEIYNTSSRIDQCVLTEEIKHTNDSGKTDFIWKKFN